ncbi:MAG TPA: glycoside hydrolase domain-containing protein [Rubrobacteraceae bacterium]|nr:glycoside hydrolase domain-containing protein [Rubrobacteraceae bacterium]
MTLYEGLDTLGYPGDTWFRNVWNNTNIWYVSYYLGGANVARGYAAILGKRSFLANIAGAGQGFGFIPIYVGQQVDCSRFYCNLTASQGQADGQDAARLMKQEGFPANSVVYFDLEDRTTTSALVTYINAWINTVNNNGYRAGVYCDVVNVANSIGNYTGWDRFHLWGVPAGSDIYVKVTPTYSNGYYTYPEHDPTSYHPRAIGVQYAEAGWTKNSLDVSVQGYPCDINTFSVKDPSMPPGSSVTDVTNGGYPQKELAQVTQSGWSRNWTVCEQKWVHGAPNTTYKTDADGYLYLPTLTGKAEAPKSS